MPTVVLLGTLDTKGREYGFVRECLVNEGVDVVLVDVGVLGDPSLVPDVTAGEVALAAGKDLASLRFSREGSDTRSVALSTMRDGAIRIIEDLRSNGRCDAILGLGGSGGTALIASVMRTLPLGVPKVVVSTMASGDVSAYVGSSDLMIMHSVTDIAGLNRISIPILRNAATAVAGMVRDQVAIAIGEHRPAVGVTMLGVTTVGALQLVDGLEELGYDAIVFHAVGSGGKALEELLEQGMLSGVIDFTIKEVTDDVFGGIFNSGPTRLRTAGERGIPQVVVPGAIEVLNFGPLDSVPLALREDGRPLVRHNDEVTAVRLMEEELLVVAEAVAERLNVATGPVHVMIPTRGFDAYSIEGGPFWDEHADSTFVTALQSALRPDIEVTLVDATINDASFVNATLEAFSALMATTVPTEMPRSESAL